MYISIFGYYVRTIVNWIEMARAAQTFFLRLTDKLKKVHKFVWNLKSLIKLLNQGTQCDEVRSFQFFIMKFGKLFSTICLIENILNSLEKYLKNRSFCYPMFLQNKLFQRQFLKIFQNLTYRNAKFERHCDKAKGWFYLCLLKTSECIHVWRWISHRFLISSALSPPVSLIELN